eukprot:399644_1
MMILILILHMIGMNKKKVTKKKNQPVENTTYKTSKKQWKSLQYTENASIHLENKLSGLMSVPPARKQTKRKRNKKKHRHKHRDNRKHKHKHKSTKHTDMTSMTNNNNIALIEEISDCVDCLLNAAGEIIKYKISGCVSLKYDHDASIKNKKYVYATVSNLENTKSHIFHPCVEIIDENGKIRIKLENNENSFEILKYIWNAKPNNIKETLPFSIELKTENIEQNVFIVSC